MNNASPRRAYFSLLPLIIFLVLVIILWRGLTLDPRKIPSALVGKPVPASFVAEALVPGQPPLTAKLFQGKVTLLTVFASWCPTCHEEQAYLMQLANNKQLQLIGLNYKDDRARARAWLNAYGNPFKTIAYDPEGKLALDWGVYGTPETFVIDRQGVIRYKQIGSFTAQTYINEVEPMLKAGA